MFQNAKNYGKTSRVLPSIRSRDKKIEDQNIILELSGSVQELQNEVNCMNDSEDFQDAKSVRSGNSHVTSRPVSFSLHPIPEGLLRHFFVSPCRKEGPPSIWDTHGKSGNVFANPHASSSAPYPQELNPWGTTIEEPLHLSAVESTHVDKHLTASMFFIHALCANEELHHCHVPKILVLWLCVPSYSLMFVV